MEPSQQPEPNRLIRLFCYDWSAYEVTGMFIKYSNSAPKRQRGRSRFCVLSEYGGNWISAREHWNNCDQWEYIDADIKTCKKCDRYRAALEKIAGCVCACRDEEIARDALASDPRDNAPRERRP